MSKIYTTSFSIIVSVLFFCNQLVAQSFPGTVINISATGTSTNSGTAAVSGVGTVANGADISLTLQFHHTWLNDMGIWLVAPTGEVLELFTRNGTGNNNANFVFSDAGTQNVTAVTAASSAGIGGCPPSTYAYNGTFKPEGRNLAVVFPPTDPSNVNAPGTYTFANRFSGINANGTWTLYMNDHAGGDGGASCTWAVIILPQVPAVQLCAQNFDALTAPALPASWTASSPTTCTGSLPWATANTGANSSPNAAFTNNPDCVSDELLDSRAFPITSATAQLSFRNSYNLESSMDGMVLEISIGAGPFSDIIIAGGAFVSGGYNGSITAISNPLLSRSAWTGNSGGYVTTTINLPASANGQSVVLRWRRATDNTASPAFTGVWIDDITITGSDCGPTSCVVTCPANIIVSNDAGQCGAVVNYTMPATNGACGPLTPSLASGSFFPVGTTTVSFSSFSGPTCSFTIRVNDTQAPVITCPSNMTVSNTTGQCGAIVTYTPTANDNCPGVTIANSPVSGSFFPVGTTTVTSTATDAAGNSSSCTFTVTVNDTQPPVIICPANVSVNNTVNQCGAVVNYSLPLASDNCATGSVSNFSATWSNTGQRGVFFDLTNIGTGPIVITSINPAMFGAAPLTDAFAVYFTTTATTYSGNQTVAGSWTLNTTSNVSFPGGASPTQVSIVLTTPLVLAAGQSKGVYVVGTLGFGGGPVAYLSTGGAPAYTGPQTYTSGSLRFTGGVGCGGLFANIFGTGSPTNFRLFYGSVSFNSPLPVVQTAGLPSGGNFPVGTTTNTYMATDAAGNSANCSFTVTVADNQPPAIVCPANITAPTTAGSCNAVVTYNVTATDNCPGTITTALVSGPASGSSLPLGVTTVTWRATDVAGNSSTCSFTITVVDSQIPVISTPPANTSVCFNSNAYFSVVSSNALSYQWQFYNGTAWVDIIGAISDTLYINNVSFAMNTNTYRVIVKGPCTDVTSTQATLTVKALPAVTLSTSRSPVLLPGQYVNITASPGTPGGTIAWYRNSVLLPTQVMLTLPNLSVDNTGTYHAVYTAPNGCTVTSGTVTVSVATSLDVFVYPNPSNGDFQVRIYAPNQPLVIYVYDAKGARVYDRRFTTGSAAYSRMNVNMPTAAGGQYVLEVRDAAGNLVGKKQIFIWR